MTLGRIVCYSILSKRVQVLICDYRFHLITSCASKKSLFSLKLSVELIFILLCHPDMKVTKLFKRSGWSPIFFASAPIPRL